MDTITQEFSSDATEVRTVLANWKDFLSDKLINNLAVCTRDGQVQVDLSNLRDDDSWDGDLRVRILNLTTEQVINYFVGWAHSDEISMDNGVLRFWWD